MDEQAILGRIDAAPDDDATLLVYADWLDEEGRAREAALIRAQCALGEAPDLADVARCHELLPPPEELPDDGASTGEVCYRRGRPAEVSSDVLLDATGIASWLDARRVTLDRLKLVLDVPFPELDGDRPLTRGLELSLWAQDEQLFEKLAHPRWAAVERLVLGGDLAESLTGSGGPDLPLRQLGAWIDEDAIPGVVRRYPDIRRFEMGGIERPAVFLEALAAWSLESLELHLLDWNDGDLWPLAGQAGLRELTVHTGGPRPMHLDRELPSLPALRRLALRASNPFDAARATALVERLPALQRLDLALRSCPAPDALAPLAGQVEELVLRWEHGAMSAAHVEALAGLRSLSLRRGALPPINSRVTDDAIATLPALGLGRLTLDGYLLGSGALRGLADAPPPSLTLVNVYAGELQRFVRTVRGVRQLDLGPGEPVPLRECLRIDGLRALAGASHDGQPLRVPDDFVVLHLGGRQLTRDQLRRGVGHGPWAAVVDWPPV